MTMYIELVEQAVFCQSGLATAFFSSKNMPLAKSLVGLLQEAKQEVPSWLIQYSESSTLILIPL